MLNFYKILELPENAGADEILQSYERLAARYDPETHANPVFAREKLEEITLAYKSLSNEVSKSWYDMRSENLAPPPLIQKETFTHNPLPSKPPKPELTKEQQREAERDAIAQRYETAGSNVAVVVQVFLWIALLFLSTFILLYFYGMSPVKKNSEGIILVCIIFLGISLHRIPNLLYLQAIYNKEFRPNAKLSEDEIPFIMLILISISIFLFWASPNLFNRNEKKSVWFEMDIPYKEFDHKILYTLEANDGPHRRVVSYESLTYKGSFDSLRIHYSPYNLDQSEIIGIWTQGSFITCKEEFYEKKTE